MEDAHENIQTGRWDDKITIDSATLVNKGLEVIRSQIGCLDVDFDDIHVVVQPKSVIHSMIQYKDGSVIAQLGTPDMKLTDSVCTVLSTTSKSGGRASGFCKVKRNYISKSHQLDVLKGLPYAYKAGRIGGSMPTVLNAANEKAVALFLDHERFSFWIFTTSLRTQ